MVIFETEQQIAAYWNFGQIADLQKSV